MRRHFHGSFRTNYQATIGAEFKSTDVEIEDTLVSMQVWDTAGQEKYQSVQGFYYRGADACVLVFDLTNIESLVGLGKWKDEFLRIAGQSKRGEFPFVLLANKADLLAERKVEGRKAG